MKTFKVLPKKQNCSANFNCCKKTRIFSNNFMYSNKNKLRPQLLCPLDLFQLIAYYGSLVWDNVYIRFILCSSKNLMYYQFFNTSSNINF